LRRFGPGSGLGIEWCLGLHVFQASLRDAIHFVLSIPPVKLAGYFRPSLTGRKSDTGDPQEGRYPIALPV